MAEERRLQTVNRQEQGNGALPISLADAEEKSTGLTTKDYYKVTKDGDEKPGAKIARALAVKHDISTEVVEYGKTNEKAWGKVRGYVGPKDNPTISMESVIIHDFKQILQQSVFDAIANGLTAPTGKRDQYGRLEKRKTILTEDDWELGPEGFPVIINPLIQFQLMNNYLDKIKFAERTAVGMAERNVILHLLGHEDDDRGRGGEREQSEGPREQKKETTQQPSALDVLRRRILGQVQKAVPGGDKIAQAAYFVSLTDAAKVAAKFPSELKTTTDAEAVLNEALRRAKEEDVKATVEVRVGAGSTGEERWGGRDADEDQSDEGRPLSEEEQGLVADDD